MINGKKKEIKLDKIGFISPGRMDQYLYPYYQRDIEKGILTKQKALEILECLWLKFNQVVYLRNQNSLWFQA